jgi:hypothetical protein
MAMFRTWFAGGSVRSGDDDRTPVGINIAVGAVMIIVAMFLAARLPVADATWRSASVAVALGTFAAFTVDPLALAALLLPTWMIMNGFLVNRLGDLSWHGIADLYRILALAGAGGLGLMLGEITRRAHGLRERWRLGVVVEAMAATEFDKEEGHRA